MFHFRFNRELQINGLGLYKERLRDDTSFVLKLINKAPNFRTFTFGQMFGSMNGGNESIYMIDKDLKLNYLILI